MEYYDCEYTAILAPLLHVQGLTNDHAIIDDIYVEKEVIKRTQPIINNAISSDIISIIDKYNVKYHKWDNSIIKNRTSSIKYLIDYANSNHHVPGDQKPSPIGLSSANSAIYPDKMLTSDWIHKYTELIPSAFLSFYEINGDLNDPQDINNADFLLINEINETKQQFIARNIKHVACITCSRSTIFNPDLELRISNIRKQTGLTNKQLFFTPSSTFKEIEISIDSILISIHSACLEFYNQLSKKIKKRSKSKQYEEGLDSTVIDIRANIKLSFLAEFKNQPDFTIKQYEHTYEILMNYIRTVDIKSSSWQSIRTLLDMVAFHIVRLYISIEFPNIAYRKFDIHIQNIIEALKSNDIRPSSYPVVTWLSIQFQWLGELIKVVPSSIIDFNKSLSSDIGGLSNLSMPQPGYIFMRAVSLLRRRTNISKEEEEEEEEENHLLSKFVSLKINDKDDGLIIKLLNECIEGFKLSNKSVFTRSIGFICFQIGEELYARNERLESIEWFKRSLALLEQDKWPYILSYIYYRLFACISEDTQEKYQYLLKLCSLEKNEKLAPTLELNLAQDVEVNYNFFKHEVFFEKSNNSLNTENRLQISLTSMLKSYLDSELTIVDEIVIEFEGSFQPIKLVHNDSDSHVLNIVTLENSGDFLTGELNLGFSLQDPKKVIQVAMTPTRIGEHSIKSIILSGHISKLKFKTELPIVHKSLSNKYLWYNDSSSNRLIKNDHPTLIEIQPRHPNTKIKVPPMKSCMMGEKFPLTITIDNGDYEPIGVYLDVVIMIDDQSLEYQWLDKEKKIEVLEPHTDINRTVVFDIPKEAGDKKSLFIEIKTIYYVNNDLNVPVKDNLALNIPIIKPFEFHLSVLPRLRDGDLSSPFLQETIATPTRLWLSNISLHYHGVEEVLQITDVKYQISTNNKELEAALTNEEIHDSVISLLPNSDEIFGQLFTTRAISSHSIRHIPLEIGLSFNWARSNSSQINKYVSSVWKIQLPITDPRLLVSYERKPNRLELKYIIENPTLRVFSFSATLAECDYVVTGTKSQSFSVLPFTRQEVLFDVKMDDDMDKKSIRLPILRVFDVNYKVHLPGLSIDEKISIDGSELVVRLR